jgi:3-methyladenine DNA glycosylase/8-oxoguanine DNA glycosylase
VKRASSSRPATIQTDEELRRAQRLLRQRDPRLAACLSTPLNLTIKRNQSPYQTLFEAVVRQQLASRAAATILGRVKSLYPDAVVPEPVQLLDTSDEALRGAGLSRAKALALRDLATKTIDGTVPSRRQIVWLSDEDIVERLITIRGIGRWTVEMLLIFNLGRTDVFPVDDYAIRRSIGLVYGMDDVPTARQLRDFGEHWRPYRTVASLSLWSWLNAKEA